MLRAIIKSGDWGMAMNRSDVEGALSSNDKALSVSARLRAALAGGTAMAILIAALGPAHATLQRKFPAAKHEQAKKEPPAKPLSVPIIAISIGGQHLTVYDKGEVVAHAPVSTGMAGHLTPMGIFSVIQKEVFHRSNIYSGAPMPYMQRVTWSGIAMHAGALPGYPASHGCIRMPHEFAVKLFSMTHQGARVLIARNDVVPTPFEHPRLFVLSKPASDKVSQVETPAVAPVAADSGPLVRMAQTQTTVMSDAVDTAARALAGMATPKPVEAAAAEPPKATEPPAAPAAVATTPPETQEIKEAVKQAPAETTHEATKDATADAAKDGAKDAQATQEPAKDGEATGTVMVKSVPVVPVQPVEVQKAFETTSAPPNPAAAIETPAAAMEKPVAADDKPAVTTEKPAAAEDKATQAVLVPYGPERPLRPGPITVFVSKKEGKVFIRKGFQPIGSWPVTFARADLPLGTHIFTAIDAKPDGESFKWLVASMPGEASKKVVETREVKGSKSKRVEKVTVTVAPSATAAEALERVEIPPFALARISSLMSTGASLIISDQGLGGETGIETDFIVLTPR
jgi:L,D-transpeptidase-like protein